MNNNEKEDAINDDDVEYFNSNFQEIDELVEGIDDLISNIETERAHALLNAFSFISDIENTQIIIDSLNDQMTEVTNLSKKMRDPQKSSFSPIIEYCSINAPVYINYKQMYDAQTELDKLQNSKIINIDSAADYIRSVLSSEDPFNNWMTTEYINHDKFCKSLTIIQNYLEQTKSQRKPRSDDGQNSSVYEELLETFKSKLFNCPFGDGTAFAPFTLCGDFLVDPINNQLFMQYFKSFTPEYFKKILPIYYLKVKGANKNIVINGKKVDNMNDFFKLMKHSKTIQELIHFIENDESQLKQYHFYHFFSNVEKNYDRILNAITDNLIPLLIRKYKIAHDIHYRSFQGTSLSDLSLFEINYMTNLAKAIIDNVKKENLLYFRNIYKYIKDTKNEIRDMLKAKFEELKDSIIKPNKLAIKIQKNPDRYKQLVNLSDIIDVCNKLGDYGFNNFIDEILKYAENEGKQKMPFEDNFTEILDNQEPVKRKIMDAFNDFMYNFVIYEANAPKITEKEKSYIFQFIHGFLECFYNKWTDHLKNSKLKNDDDIDSCLKYVYWLYTALKFYPISDENETMYNDYEKFQPKLYNNEKDIYSSIDAIDQNIINPSIPALKKNCYKDLKMIINTLPREKVEARWHS